MTDSRLRFIQRADGADEAEIRTVLDQTIEVRLPTGTPMWRHQLLALALVDLLGRMFPRISVVCDPTLTADARLPPGELLLLDRFTLVREHALTPPETPGEPTIIVQVGIDPAATSSAAVHVDGGGWMTYVGQTPSKLAAGAGAPIAVGPLAAACRGASQVFQLAVGELLTWTPRLIASNYWSALSYQSSEEPFDEVELPAPAFIEALLVGAGSIGGAAVYLLANTPDLRGALDIVDPETLDEHNPDRALLATKAAAEAHAVKAEVAVGALAHHSELSANPHKERVAAFVAGRPREQTLPMVLSAVDSVESRREIQDSLPLDVLDAACSPSQISVSVHRTDDGPCLYCLHIENVLAAETIRKRLLMRATGFNEKLVIQLLIDHVPLDEQHLRVIEAHRELPTGKLDHFRGQTLETLYNEELLYGEVRVSTSSGAEGVVAAAFTTALAGFLLAGEALKAGAGEAYAAYRLGPHAIATQYLESLWASPADGSRENPSRWPTHECLCQNGRRLALLRERYGLCQAA